MNKRIRYNIALAGGLFVACCGPRGSELEVATRSALNVLADVVSPASKAARSSCDALEELAVAEVRAGKRTAADAKAHVNAVRKRCEQVRENIDLLRATHQDAVERVEAGDFREAMDRIEQAQKLFRTLSTDVESKK